LAGEEDGAGALAGGGEDVGLAGEVVGAGALAGVGLGMACLTEDTDLATPAMVMVQHRPMATTPGKGV